MLSRLENTAGVTAAPITVGGTGRVVGGMSVLSRGRHH
jgi:hypothetical protein